MLLPLIGQFLPLYEGEGSGGGAGSSGANSTGESGGAGEGEREETAPDFKSWLSNQDEQIQTLINDNTTGLKSALTSERESRKKAETKLREVAKDLEEGSKARQELETTADQLGEMETKAEFYEVAHEAGVTDLKLAYIVAKEEKLIDKRGNVDFDKLKEAHPSLFASPRRPPGDAGAGTGGEGSGRTRDMNAAIRAAAGRK